MSCGKAAKKARHFCLECQGSSAKAVLSCGDICCPLFSVRLCTTEPIPEGVKVLRQIRQHCLVCAGSRAEVRSCSAKETCGLWSYRFGVLPATFKRVLLRQKKQRTTLFLPGFGEAKYL